MINLLIIGSTGSIGTQTLDVVRSNPHEFNVVGLVAHSNTEVLQKQITEFRPKVVGVYDSAAYSKIAHPNKFCGEDALTAIIDASECDCVVVSVVGMLGLKSVLHAIKAKKKIALANKESLVAGGALVMPLAKKYGVSVVPIDSEHSAIAQCMHSGTAKDVCKLILTASGGPFYGKTVDELKHIMPAQALRHPTWNMGAKISIDSATMFNKALEIIEAKWLYNTTNITYTIHRQSIVHSLVEFIDGSTIAQMSYPDMRLPIQQAISNKMLPRASSLDMHNLNLTFTAPDENIFKAPRLALDLLNTDNYILHTVFNSANEKAVQLFLNGKIGFLDIYKLVNNAVQNFKDTVKLSVDNIFEVDKQIKST